VKKKDGLVIPNPSLRQSPVRRALSSEDSIRPRRAGLAPCSRYPVRRDLQDGFRKRHEIYGQRVHLMAHVVGSGDRFGTDECGGLRGLRQRMDLVSDRVLALFDQARFRACDERPSRGLRCRGQARVLRCMSPFRSAPCRYGTGTWINFHGPQDPALSLSRKADRSEWRSPCRGRCFG